MRLSVALCTWNGERFLPRQLASLAAQTRKPDEVVVFDDASTDGTLAQLEQFAATARFDVRVFRNPERLGVVANFEQAIVACTGDVIFLCDQDDEWLPEKIARIASRFASDPALGGVFTDAERIGEDGAPLGSLWRHIDFAGDTGELIDRNVATGATMAFRASHRERILPIPRDAGMLHDEWIALVLGMGGKLSAIDERLIRYRVHAAQQAGPGKEAGGTARWIEAARETGRSDYARKARRLELVAGRVNRPDLLPRAEHLRFRAQLPDARLRRLIPVLREIPNYVHYSNHVWSIGRDLLW